MKKIAVMQATAEYIDDTGGNVGDQVNPGNARGNSYEEGA
jgi:hypothetical protein